MSSRWSNRLTHAFVLRLALWYVAVFLVSAIGLSSATYLLLGRSLAAQDHRVLESTLRDYAGSYSEGGLASLERAIDADAAAGLHDRLLVRVVGPGAEVIYFAAPAGWSGFDLSILDTPAGHDSVWLTIGGQPDGSALEVGSIRMGNVAIQVGRSSHVRDEVLRHFRATGLEVLALVTIVAVAGGGLLTHAGLAPLRRLERDLRSIIRIRRFDDRVEVRHTGDALDDLADLVNQLLDRIQKLVSAMRGALDNVAHDLRTPLTRLRNLAEAAVMSGDETAMREGLGYALEEADRVNATLTTLIDISEAETGTMRLALAPVRLAEVVDEAVTLYADTAEQKGLTLRATIDPAVELVADRTRLRQVFANLIDNAVKYTPAGGSIDISASVVGGQTTVVVRDNGIGLSSEDTPLVWDRLYRGDASRSTRGLGLGLSLVKAIVEGHGGRVDVTSTPGQGSAFSVSLPIAGSPVA